MHLLPVLLLALAAEPREPAPPYSSLAVVALENETPEAYDLVLVFTTGATPRFKEPYRLFDGEGVLANVPSDAGCTVGKREEPWGYELEASGLLFANAYRPAAQLTCCGP